MPHYTEQEKLGWLESWKTSGLSAISFSKDKSFSASSLNYWKRKIRSATESSFIQVIPNKTIMPPYVRLTYPSGVVLEFYTPVKSEYIKGLLE
jgi:hypothetical protein